LAKKIKLDEKRRIKEEKKLAKKLNLEEKKRKKEKRKYSKKSNINENNKLIKTSKLEKINKNTKLYSSKFEYLVKDIINKNNFRSYPSINDIPN
jgi:hypothetical protein